MVLFSKDLKKNEAIYLRKKGLSYSEIKKEILVSKSSLSRWLKGVKLTENQATMLKERQVRIARENFQRRILDTRKKIEKIKNSSAQELKNISKRELWLMGVMLYWRERLLHDNESDLQKGVRLTSSDPNIVKFFLRWLQDVGQIQKEEIGFDIFIQEESIKNKERVNSQEHSTNSSNMDREEAAEAINYWAQITDAPKENFSRIYFQKNRKKITKRKSSKRAHYGLLRVRVKASSMLARQISGWVKGIIQQT